MPEDRISAIDLFDDVEAEGFPLFIPRMSLIWVIEREADDPQIINGQFTISLENHELGKFPFSANFEHLQLVRQIISIGGLVIPQPGRLKIVFSAPNMADALYEFRISAKAQVQPANPPAPVAHAG
jgi:hypothetical protein